jgi:hypothetical protein
MDSKQDLGLWLSSLLVISLLLLPSERFVVKPKRILEVLVMKIIISVSILVLL